MHPSLATPSIASDLLEQCKYLREEYKYRHDLIWQRIFTFTIAIVVISIIPYVQQDIANQLGIWILIAPVLATALAGFVLLVIRCELKLYGKIKQAYRRQQTRLFGEDLEHELEDSSFNRYVLFYLSVLLVLSIANGLVTWLVWINNTNSVVAGFP